MATTVSQLAEEAANEVGEPYSDQDVAYRFQRWVADCAAEIFSLRPNEWPFLITSQRMGDSPFYKTIIGQATYEFDPIAAGTVTGIQYGTGSSAVQLRGTTRDHLLALGADLTEAGTPTHWYINGVAGSGGVQVALWPVPSAEAALSAWFTQQDPVLDAATAEVELPRDVLRAIRLCVIARYHEQSEDSSDKTTANAQARYQQAIAGLIERYIYTPAVEHEIRFTRRPDPFFPPLRMPAVIIE